MLITRSHRGKHVPTQEFSEARKIDGRFKRVHPVLGAGTYGVVEKVTYSHNNRSIYLARKHIKRRRGVTIQKLREEADVMEKLVHDHIVKLVGTYAMQQNELFILLWPVAACNLDNLFDDLDALRTGQGDRDDIISRLEALDLKDLTAFERKRVGPAEGTSTGACPLKMLRQMVGCLAHAVAFCHANNIRHLDLKPSNILLNPGRVYLADFGIARNVEAAEHTMTIGPQGTPKWRAPEVRQYRDARDEWSMKSADIYALGLIYLNISTLLYGRTMADFDAIMDEEPANRADKLKQFLPKLEIAALATQEVENMNAPTFGPKSLVSLTAKMLTTSPSLRPRVDQVDAELVDLGGVQQIYHNSCCRKSSRFVTERMNRKLRAAYEERDRLAVDQTQMLKRITVLEAKDETYESRIGNERKSQAGKIANLQEQLEKERDARKKLEETVAELQGRGGRKRPGLIPRPETRAIPTGPRASPKVASPDNNPSSSLPSLLTRPRTHPLPKTSIPMQRSPSGNQALPKVPTVAINAAHAQLSYSQTVAAGLRTSLNASAQRPELAKRGSIDVMAAANLTSGSPSPGPIGNYPLRSSNSGSRLPIAVNPSTPIRGGTPTLHRDLSLTDSTQFSMASSTFSRRSGQSRDSGSGTGTPALVPSPFQGGDDKLKETDRTALTERRNAQVGQESRDLSPTEETTKGVGLGLSYALAERRDSVALEIESTLGSDAAPGTASSVITGSAVSSPRAAKAELDGTANERRKRTMVVPLSMPTAQSWAEVAKR
jgi:serine/threonine protein kinase